MKQIQVNEEKGSQTFPDLSPKATPELNAARCQGWRRHGGAFTLGPVSWHQCEESGTVMLTVKQGGKSQTLPSCQTCWNECIENGIEITNAVPVEAAQ